MLKGKACKHSNETINLVDWKVRNKEPRPNVLYGTTSQGEKSETCAMYQPRFPQKSMVPFARVSTTM